MNQSSHSHHPYLLFITCLLGIRRIKGLFHHTHRHRNAVEDILRPVHAGNLQCRHALAAPPQARQVATYPRAPSLDATHQFTLSILNTRFSLCAQVIAMDGMYAGFAGAKTGHRPMRWRECFLILIRCHFPAARAAPGRGHPRLVR